MPVAAEIASMLDALDAPAMLIRPDDMTVAAVNDAFAQAYGRFRFEGKRCWEALHRAGPCPKSGLPCPLAQADKVGVSCVEQTLFSSARVTELAVTMRPVRSADGKTLYWLETLRSKTDDAEPFRRGTVGVSRAHAEVMHALERLASEDVPYLIVGEAGVGKELYARTVHENSARASRPFVVVAGSCLTGTAAQTLLCGTENAAGLLERADGGSLFVDDIECASPVALEILEAVRIGGCTSRRDGTRLEVSVRLSASARRLPQEHTTENSFLSALASREVFVPPLRERKEDIAPLAKFFVGGIAPVHSRTITNEAIEMLQRYDWPGNMRELKNVLSVAAQGTDRTVTSANLTLPEAHTSAFLGEDEDIVPLADIKNRYLVWAVETFRGPRSELAAKLGISERTLYRLHAQSKSRT